MESDIIGKLIRLEEIVDRHSEIIHELKEKNEIMYKLVTSVELIAQDMTYLKDDVKSIKQGQDDIFKNIEEVEKKVRTVENADVKKEAKIFENLKKELLWLFVGGFAAMILNSILDLVHVG